MSSIDDFKVETDEKQDINTQKEEYNNNKVENKSLEQEVKEETDKKFLAKTIVDLKEENQQIKDMLKQVLSKMKVNDNEFTSSQASSNNQVDNKNDDSKYFLKINN